MPRPSTKQQLIDLAEKEFAALERTIAGLAPAEKRPEGSAESWAAEDFIAHLWEWQNMFFGWYEAGLKGENPPTPAPGYKWSQLPALNLEIYKKNHGRPVKEVLTGLQASHRRMMDLAKSLSEEELFTPGLYPWLRTNTLAAYLTSAGSSHYLWARKEIQKAAKFH